jgi:hypothetical protein
VRQIVTGQGMIRGKSSICTNESAVLMNTLASYAANRSSLTASSPVIRRSNMSRAA